MDLNMSLFTINMLYIKIKQFNKYFAFVFFKINLKYLILRRTHLLKSCLLLVIIEVLILPSK